MFRFKKIVVIFILFSSLCSACGDVKKADIREVKIAFFPNITHSQALIGKANGKFQEELGDIPIAWRTFNAGPSEIEALFAGEVDIGYIGPVPAINGYVKSNGDLKIIAGATDGGAILVSRKDLKIHEVIGLSGKKVAVPQFGNTQYLSLLQLLRENGLKTTDKGGTVEVIQANNPDIKTLLDNGTIDAALVPEPWGARLTNEIDANVILNYNEIWREGVYPTAVVIVRTEFLNQYPDIVENFMKAHVEITEYINSNPDDAKGIVNQQIYELTKSSLEANVLNEAFERMSVTYSISEEALFEFFDLLRDEGFVKEAGKENLLDISILNKVKGEK